VLPLTPTVHTCRDGYSMESAFILWEFPSLQSQAGLAKKKSLALLKAGKDTAGAKHK